jgi:uncharacterized heparinase superfamily protein
VNVSPNGFEKFSAVNGYKVKVKYFFYMNLPPKSLPLYLQTIKYLRPQQILYKVGYALRNRLSFLINHNAEQSPKKLHCKPLEPVVEFLTYPWFNTNDTAIRKFRFLNKHYQFTESIDWQIHTQERLWRYNLHYFQYLHPIEDLSEEIAIPLIIEWIENNPPGSADAWDPFPISLRIVNWIKYLSCSKDRNENTEKIVRSIYQQSVWLSRSIEYHNLANHIFKNAKALVFAGLFLQGNFSVRLLRKGLNLLSQEIDEQILEDGGHFERSPMYHSMILEDCLDLINILQSRTETKLVRVKNRLLTKVGGMVRFLLGLTHPDGEIGLFNDAALGIEPNTLELINYYKNLTGELDPEFKEPTVSFPISGYFIFRPDSGNRMLVDGGLIGPEYQTGHSHCDNLSFELSLKGKRVIVDSGCFGYESGKIRKYNRGNAGHNTLTIDCKNQSEVWDSFRCARRARPLYSRLRKLSDGTILFEGAHDGYRRLNGSPVHHRRIRWSKNYYLIEDSVEGRGGHDVESQLHIHPSLSVNATENEFIVSDGTDVLARISSLKENHVEKITGWYCPEFGIKKKCVVLRIKCEKVSLPWIGGWKIRTEG